MSFLRKHGNAALGALLLWAALERAFAQQGGPPEPSLDAPPRDPRLVVLIVIDQFRGDCIRRFDRYFGPDGFRRLEQSGALFTNAYYSYGASVTAAGHATIATGRLPRQHGIIANSLFTGAEQKNPPAAVHDPGTQLVSPQADRTAAGMSPRLLIGSTIGDEMKLADRRSRVFSVASKDRAAIFLGGHQADMALWFHSGEWASSTYYASQLPEFVARLEREKPAARWVAATWDTLLPARLYDGCHPLDPSWFPAKPKLGDRFPHVLPAETPPGEGYYAALRATPFANELVLDLASQMLRDQRLGRGPAPDLLCVGLSANDYCGHQFGPESAEVMDMALRTDRQLADFLKILDREVGLAHCLVALTADHGVTTIGQIANRARMPGGSIDLEQLAQRINRESRQEFAEQMAGRDLVRSIQMPWIYFEPWLESLDVGVRQSFARIARDVARSTPGVADVYTLDEVSGPAPSRDETGKWLAWRCTYVPRAGQLYVQLAPYWREMGDDLAGHSAGVSSDRHVPILLCGPEVRAGRYDRPADPLDIAPTLASLLGIEAPIDGVGRVLSEALTTATPR